MISSSRFDRGTLSRRHLIQGLTALAAAGGALPRRRANDAVHARRASITSAFK